MEQEASELMRGLSSTVDSEATIESLKGLMALIERADGATAEELAAALRRHGAVQRLCALVDDAAFQGVAQAADAAPVVGEEDALPR